MNSIWTWHLCSWHSDFSLILNMDVIIQEKSYKKNSNGFQQIWFAKNTHPLEENYFSPLYNPPQNQAALNNDYFPLRNDVKTVSEEEHWPLTHMGCAQPTTGWKGNPRALPEATLFHESGWSQKCHELQFHSKWRRDIRKVFLQASSKYKFTCLCCLKRHLESRPKITSSLRIYMNLCNMIRKDCPLKPKDAITKPINYGTKTHTCEGDHGPLYCRKGTCKNNWVIKEIEQWRIYFSFCRSFLPAQ